MTDIPVCSIDGCCKPRVKREWCSSHYARWRRGTPLDAPMRFSPGSKIEWLIAHAQYGGDDCLRWPFYYNPNGYGDVPYNGKVTSANRAMCTIAHGNPPTPDHEAAHSCGNGKGGCLNPRHLDWLTAKQNQGDRSGHQTDNRGLRAHANKLTEGQIYEIRAAEGIISAKELASHYACSAVNIRHIWKRKNWAWLPDK